MWHQVLVLTAEPAMIAGLVLQFLALLSPVPWTSNNLSRSFLTFTPYVEPPGYLAPNSSCGTSSSNQEGPLYETEPDEHQHPRRSMLLRFRRIYARESSSVPIITATSSNDSKIAVWIGPLGSCSRDAHGSTYCSNPSYSSPTYNLTHVQENDVFSPTTIHKVVKRQSAMTVVLFSIINLALFMIASFSFWFPRISLLLFPNYKGRLGFFSMAFLIPSAFIEGAVIISIAIRHIERFNLVDNFYFSAPWGQVRQLKPGTLVVASGNGSWRFLMIGWSLICVCPIFHVYYRGSWTSDFIKSDDARAFIAKQDVIARLDEVEARRKRTEKARIKEENPPGTLGDAMLMKEIRSGVSSRPTSMTDSIRVSYHTSSSTIV